MKLNEFMDSSFQNDSYIQNKIKSPQYVLSDEILQLENQLGYSQKKLAQKLAISYKKLLDLESASSDYKIEEYKDTIRFIKKLINQKNSIGEYSLTYQINDENNEQQNKERWTWAKAINKRSSFNLSLTN